MSWRDAWFFVSLLAVLSWGLGGIAGSVTSFFGMRVLSRIMPARLAALGALLVGVATVALVETLLRR